MESLTQGDADSYGEKWRHQYMRFLWGQKQLRRNAGVREQKDKKQKSERRAMIYFTYEYDKGAEEHNGNDSSFSSLISENYNLKS